MALPTITITDFTGVIALSANRFDSARYTAYIDPTKMQYIADLLGAAAYEDMLTYDKEKWTALLAGGSYNYVEDGIGKVGRFAGFNSCLLYLIYFTIVRDDFTMSDTGAVNNLNENTTKVKHYAIAQDRYNKAVAMLNDVYLYVDRMKYIEVSIDSSIDNGGTFTITADAPLLADGDTITMAGVDYVVFNRTLIAFDITATEIDTTFTYSPYSSVIQSPLYLSYL